MFEKPSICFSVFAFMALGAPPVALASMIKATITSALSAQGSTVPSPAARLSLDLRRSTSLAGQSFTLGPTLSTI